MKIGDRVVSRIDDKDKDKNKDRAVSTVRRRFLMSGFPDENELFLVEASLVHEVYTMMFPEVIVRSIICECGHIVYKQLIRRTGGDSAKRDELEVDLTERTFNDLMRGLEHRPIEKECRAYIMEDGLKINICKIDNTFYYGEVDLKHNRSWEPGDVIERYIIHTSDELDMAKYWSKTRLGVK